MPRDIQDILHFRSDLPPFLVHLTRPGHLAREFDGPRSAADNLRSILTNQELLPGRSPPWVSDARFGIDTRDWDRDRQKRFFQAISLTETPLNEVHCLLEIEGRAADLRPYGLLFLKEKMANKGVCPVWYVNNFQADQNRTFRHLASLIESHPETAERVLPLMAVFGQQVTAPGAAPRGDEIDFRWEREWRLPAAQAPLEFTEEEVFVGLCPHDEIDEFEELYEPVEFIDPRRNMKWYATKLIAARQRLDLAYSVV